MVKVVITILAILSRLESFRRFVVEVCVSCHLNQFIYLETALRIVMIIAVVMMVVMVKDGSIDCRFCGIGSSGDKATTNGDGVDGLSRIGLSLTG